MAISSKNKDILKDPRYQNFVERYHADPLRFAVEVTGLVPSGDQVSLFRAISPSNARVSVVSGTGTGKTFAFARIALWHLLCFPIAAYDGKVEVGSNTYIGAPIIQQVGDGVWKEMKDTCLQIADGPHRWILDYFEITKTRVFVKLYENQWFIAQIAMKKGESVGIAGKHRFWQLVIIDEAAGVPDEHFKVIQGTQTQPGNRTLLASQGVKNTGFFYDTHHSLAKKSGGSWEAIRFSSERSPFVTLDWLKERAIESGGVNSVEYKIRVLGLFAQDSSNYLLTREEVETIFTRGRIIDDDEPFGYLVLSDVAMGEYRDESVVWISRVIGSGDFGEDALRLELIALPICSNEKNQIDLAGDLIDITSKRSNATLAIDAGGVGSSVCQLIERSDVSFPMVKINWGKPCFKKAYRNRFFNQRACAMVRLRDAIRQGRVSVLADLDQRTKEKIIDEGSRLPYHFTEAGGLRYQMQKKEEMRKEGIKSPDLMDAMSFPFVEGVVAMAAEESSGKTGSAAARLMRQAENVFADV